MFRGDGRATGKPPRPGTFPGTRLTVKGEFAAAELLLRAAHPMLAAQRPTRGRHTKKAAPGETYEVWRRPDDAATSESRVANRVSLVHLICHTYYPSSGWSMLPLPARAWPGLGGRAEVKVAIGRLAPGMKIGRWAHTPRMTVDLSVLLRTRSGIEICDGSGSMSRQVYGVANAAASPGSVTRVRKKARLTCRDHRRHMPLPDIARAAIPPEWICPRSNRTIPIVGRTLLSRGGSRGERTAFVTGSPDAESRITELN